MSAPTLVIVGRPNVGKSTLFNRLFGRRRALVHDLPGVTRDRLIETVQWHEGKQTHTLRLVDTGGLGEGTFSDEIQHQVSAALDEASLVLFVFDSQVGWTAEDREVLRALQKARGSVGRKFPILGIANKIDTDKHEERVAEFYASGLDEIVGISAEHGRGSEDLKSQIIAILKSEGALVSPEVRKGDEDGEDLARDSFDEESEIDAEREAELERPELIPRIAIVGRPNVGKSTLVNAILGENRMITSPVAGTTIDAIDSEAEIDGRKVVLIDTAGIRRKNKTEQGVEVLSVVQSTKALERCHVAILVVDGENGIIEQDEKIGGLIEDAGCGVIIVVNKWDTQKSNQKFTQEMAAERIRKQMAYLRYAPIVFTSAKERRGHRVLGELIEEIIRQRRTKLTTHEFTEWVRKESVIHNPKAAKFYLCHQAGRNPPTFVCHVNDPNRVHFSLQRHLINAIRERWGFMGSPVRLLFVKGKNAPNRPVPRPKG